MYGTQYNNYNFPSTGQHLTVITDCTINALNPMKSQTIKNYYGIKSCLSVEATIRQHCKHLPTYVAIRFHKIRDLA